MSVTELDIQSFYPPELKITEIVESDDQITIHMHSISHEAICHKCGAPLIRHHGTHRRRVQDLPVLGKRVMLDMQIYDYQCTSASCGSFAATETFNGFLSYNSRMTDRLEDFICLLALETSCEASARILNSVKVKVSGDTVIRLLIKRYMKQPEKMRSLKEWLQKNKHVTTVTRDRASAYAKAVEEVLPDCMQIADRFHIHQNLMDAVNKVLGPRYHDEPRPRREQLKKRHA